MKVKTNQESTGRNYYVGVGEFQVLMFNPTRAELNELFGKEGEENPMEIEYVKEDVEVKVTNSDGSEADSIFCNRLSITAWVKEVSTESIYPINFYIYNTPEKSKTGKIKFVNQFGRSIYVDSEENLPDSIKFTPGKIKQPLNYRQAYKGESEFMDFLSAWVNPNVFEADDNSLFPENTKRFWNGDMSELNGLIGDLETHTVMATVFVKKKETTDENGNTTERIYNNVSSRAFCNGSNMKYFRNYFQNNFEGLTKSSKIGNVSMYNLANFLDQSFGEYGVKDFTIKAPITKYSEDMNPVNSEAAIVQDDPGY